MPISHELSDQFPLVEKNELDEKKKIIGKQNGYKIGLRGIIWHHFLPRVLCFAREDAREDGAVSRGFGGSGVCHCGRNVLLVGVFFALELLLLVFRGSLDLCILV